MANLLQEYMQKRHPESKKKRSPGPAITISREFGCPEKLIAKKLTARLSKQGENWQLVSKEILDKAANELKIKTYELESSLDTDAKGLLPEIFYSLSFYPSDKKIRNRYSKVIKGFARKGFVIIIGRGSEIITNDIKKSLHIKLTAPLSWRAAQYSKRHEVSMKDAEKKANELDKRRAAFRKYFTGDTPEKDFYDLTFNCASFSADNIVDSIIDFCRIKKLF